jgi:hypothetical protein
MGIVSTQCPSIYGLFAQYLRYAQKIILGISIICLWLFFFACLDLDQKSSYMDGHCIFKRFKVRVQGNHWLNGQMVKIVIFVLLVELVELV